MEEVKRFKIDEGTLGYMLALRSEREGLRVLNCQLIRAGDDQNGNYENFLEQYKSACKEWEVAYQELVKALAGQWLDEETTTKINFLTGELIVYRGDDGLCCG